jgi:hypothetical protein
VLEGFDASHCQRGYLARAACVTNSLTVAPRGGSDSGQCSLRFCVIVRRLLQHETFLSRRTLLRGLASAGSVLALGGCGGLGATGARFDAWGP